MPKVVKKIYSKIKNIAKDIVPSNKSLLQNTSGRDSLNNKRYRQDQIIIGASVFGMAPLSMVGRYY